MTLLITYIAIALGFSFLCSLLEATLLTITPTQLQAAKSSGKRWAHRLQALKMDVDKPLSAILTLNTIAHTMGATGAGAQYAKIYGDATGGLFAGALTFAVLVLTEIIPKTLGARYTLFFAPFTASFLPFLAKGLHPVVWFCQGITRLITFNHTADHPKHREELLAMARLGMEEGALDPSENQIVGNTLRLNRINTADIMTPRPVVFMLPEEMSLSEFVEQVEGQAFSRIPVYQTSGKQISGYVIRSEALEACIKDSSQSLNCVIRDVEFVLGSLSVDQLLKQMVQQRLHMALVLNEFGTNIGLVTLEDVLETLVGVEIVDEKDTVTDLQKMARNLWTKRAERMGLAVQKKD